METVSSLPGRDGRSYCNLTGPHTGSDLDASEGEISRHVDGYTIRAVTFRRPMETGGKALLSVVQYAVQSKTVVVEADLAEVGREQVEVKVNYCRLEGVETPSRFCIPM
jgi:hypothetical protein